MILHREENETLNDVVNRYSDEVHLRVAKAVCEALEQDKERAHILTILPDQYELFCTRSNYEDSLVTNLPFVEQLEEYELCQRMHSWISKLKYAKYENDLSSEPKSKKKK